jgi:hypothetical protein
MVANSLRVTKQSRQSSYEKKTLCREIAGKSEAIARSDTLEGLSKI